MCLAVKVQHKDTFWNDGVVPCPDDDDGLTPQRVCSKSCTSGVYSVNLKMRFKIHNTLLKKHVLENLLPVVQDMLAR